MMYNCYMAIIQANPRWAANSN